MSAGRKIITEIKLKMMPLTRFMPRSAPIWKLIKERAKKPNVVVNALAAIVGSDVFKACPIASNVSPYFSRLSANLCNKKMA